MARRGRIIINTGDGKGKTTAALGTAFRALGHGHRVCVIQFIKGQGEYGERLLARSFQRLEWHVCGKGFLFNKEHLQEDRRIAREGFELARRKIMAGESDLVILDEITYLPHYGFLETSEIADLLRSKPPQVSIILTGRNAPAELIELADTVSEIRCLKHGYQEGIKAQKGIEY